MRKLSVCIFLPRKEVLHSYSMALQVSLSCTSIFPFHVSHMVSFLMPESIALSSSLFQRHFDDQKGHGRCLWARSTWNPWINISCLIVFITVLFLLFQLGRKPKWKGKNRMYVGKGRCWSHELLTMQSFAQSVLVIWAAGQMFGWYKSAWFQNIVLIYVLCCNTIE